jgi:hypothetical protein
VNYIAIEIASFSLHLVQPPASIHEEYHFLASVFCFVSSELDEHPPNGICHAFRYRGKTDIFWKKI